MHHGTDSARQTVESVARGADLAARQLSRRRTIIDRARELLDDRPFEAVQMRDIGKAAGVALGTLYRYFPSKEQLYAEVLGEWIITHLADAPATAHDAATRLQWKIDVVMTAYADHPRFAATQRRILLSESPTVKEPLEVGQNASLAWLKEDLSVLSSARSQELAGILLAVLNAIVEQVSASGQPKGTTRRMGTVFVELIESELREAENAAGVGVPGSPSR